VIVACLPVQTNDSEIYEAKINVFISGSNFHLQVMGSSVADCSLVRTSPAAF